MTHTCPTLLPPSNFIWLELGDLRFGFPILVCAHPLAPNPTQHNTGAAVRLYAEKDNSNTASKPAGLQVTQPSHCSCAWPLLLCLAIASLTAQAGRFCQLEEGSEKTGLRHAQLWSWSFHFPPTHAAVNNPHFPEEPPIQSRAGPAESLILLILPSEGRKQALPPPTYRSIKNAWVLRNDPQAIPSRAASLTWSCRIQTTFQCKYQLR